MNYRLICLNRVGSNKLNGIGVAYAVEYNGRVCIDVRMLKVLFQTDLVFPVGLLLEDLDGRCKCKNSISTYFIEFDVWIGVDDPTLMYFRLLGLVFVDDVGRLIETRFSAVAISRY